MHSGEKEPDGERRAAEKGVNDPTPPVSIPVRLICSARYGRRDA